MQDYAQAYLWWLLAEKNGAKDIEHNKEEIIKKMHDSQIKNAEELAKVWLEKNGKP